MRNPSNQRHTRHREYSKDSNWCGVQAEGDCGDRRHKRTCDINSRGPRHNDCVGIAGTGCSLQLVRHSLGGGESERPAWQETSAAVTDEEWQGEVRQGQLHVLPVRPHLRQRHMCEDNVSAMGAEGCRKETGNCSAKTGFFNQQTRRWNHHNTIGGKAARSVKGPSKDEVQNRVPLKLLLEILQALPECEGQEQPSPEGGGRPRPGKGKERGRRGGTTKVAPNVLCQFRSAQARYHQPMSVVPSTDGGDLEDHTDATQRTWALH